jgi:hypothetical protein
MRSEIRVTQLTTSKVEKSKQRLIKTLGIFEVGHVTGLVDQG